MRVGGELPGPPRQTRACPSEDSSGPRGQCAHRPKCPSAGPRPLYHPFILLFRLFIWYEHGRINVFI